MSYEAEKTTITAHIERRGSFNSGGKDRYYHAAKALAATGRYRLTETMRDPAGTTQYYDPFSRRTKAYKSSYHPYLVWRLEAA